MDILGSLVTGVRSTEVVVNRLSALRELRDWLQASLLSLPARVSAVSQSGSLCLGELSSAEDPEINGLAVEIAELLLNDSDVENQHQFLTDFAQRCVNLLQVLLKTRDRPNRARLYQVFFAAVRKLNPREAGLALGSELVAFRDPQAVQTASAAISCGPLDAETMQYLVVAAELDVRRLRERFQDAPRLKCLLRTLINWWKNLQSCSPELLSTPEAERCRKLRFKTALMLIGHHSEGGYAELKALERELLGVLGARPPK